MDGKTHQPLTVTEAKERFLAAAQEASFAAWVRKSPWESMAAALLMGMLFGMSKSARKEAWSAFFDLYKFIKNILS